MDTNLAELLVPEAITTDLKSDSKEAALEELIKLLESAQKVHDPSAVLKAILEREQLGSTGFGAGVALPHARMPGLKGIQMAIGLSQKGVEFEAPDHQPVKIFFLIVGPQENPEAYLKILSQIARAVKGDNFRTSLMACNSGMEVISLVREEFS